MKKILMPTMHSETKLIGKQNINGDDLTLIGIYKIENTKTNKFYIGQSINIHNRWKQHKSALTSNRHHSIKLQNSWNKHGYLNFKFEVIEECEVSKLNDRELYHIEKHNAKINGYNMNGEYEFYKVLDKKEIKTNVEEFCDMWAELLKLRKNYVPQFYFRDVHFEMRGAKTLKKSNKILRMIKNIHNDLRKLDYEIIYKLNYVYFVNETYKVEEYPMDNSLYLSDTIDSLLSEFILRFYEAEEIRPILKLIHVPMPIIKEFETYCPYLYKYYKKTHKSEFV